MPKTIRLKGRKSQEKPGTIQRHFGVDFVVQSSGFLEATLNDEIAEMLIKPERADEIKNSSVKEEQYEEETEETEEEINFQQMSKEELIAWAYDTHGVELDKKYSKADLVATCKELESPNNE